MNFWDRITARTKTENDSEQASRDKVVADTKGLCAARASKAGPWVKEIRKYEPQARGFLAKVRNTKYVKDKDVDRLVTSIEGALANAGTVELALKEYDSLSWSDFVNSYTKQLDVNRPRQVAGSINARLLLCSGGSAGIEKMIKQIEARIEQLEEREQYDARISEPAVTITVPQPKPEPKPAPKPWDSREPYNP